MADRSSARTAASVALLVVLAIAGISWGAGPVRADRDAALKILKSMSDYVAGQKTIAVTFDAGIEVVTPEIEKIQFNNSGQILLARPDKLRASRIGGYADVELIFDGKKVSILGRNINAYTEVDALGTTDQMYDRLRNDYGIQMPGADLLLSNVFNVLSRDVIDAKHIGAGVIGGLDASISLSAMRRRTGSCGCRPDLSRYRAS